MDDWAEIRHLFSTGKHSKREIGRLVLLRSVGIVLAPGDMDFRPPVFHDLRHIAVSLYLSVTKNVKHVQRIAGHKDPTTTLNTHTELFDDDFFKAAAGLDSLMAE